MPRALALVCPGVIEGIRPYALYQGLVAKVCGLGQGVVWTGLLTKRPPSTGISIMRGVTALCGGLFVISCAIVVGLFLNGGFSSGQQGLLWRGMDLDR